MLSIACLAAAGCGNGSSDLEQGIRDDLSASANVTAAKCPDDAESGQGRTFTCDVEFDNGATAKADVTRVGDKRFEYELARGSVRVPGETVETELERALNEQQGVTGAMANCPDDIVVKPRATLSCDVSGVQDSDTGTVTFTFSSEEGTVDPSSVKTP
jgi:hypothetical protein